MPQKVQSQSPLPPSDVAPPLGDGQLRLIRVLGKGGVGTVYLARNEVLGVYRAVKVLSPTRAESELLRKRFTKEASIQARLKHPNIVEVYNIREEHGQYYFEMEWVPGGSLWEVLREGGPIEPHQAVRACISILAALEVAHTHDIIHRDIKPHNALITLEGEVKLADFGVAHEEEFVGEDITSTGVVMGTWAFMAPEQRASSRRVDATSDLYSVGATLHTLLTDKPDPELFDHDERSIELLPVPYILRPIICKATRYAREERYRNAKAMRQDLIDALARLAGTDPGRLIPPPPPPPPPQPVASEHTLVPDATAPDDTTDPDGRSQPLLAEPVAPPPSGPVGMDIGWNDQSMQGVAAAVMMDSEAEVSVHVDMHLSESSDGPVGMHLEVGEATEADRSVREPSQGRNKMAIIIPILVLAGMALVLTPVLVQHWSHAPVTETEEALPSPPEAPPTPPEPAPEPVARPEAAPEPAIVVEPIKTLKPEPVKAQTSRVETPKAPPPVKKPVTPASPPVVEEEPVSTVSAAEMNAAVQSTARARRSDLLACHRSALATNPTEEGLLRIQMKVASGKPTSVSIPLNTTGDAGLADCVAGKVKGWSFPEYVEGSQTITTSLTVAETKG